jgi:sulfotransferase
MQKIFYNSSLPRSGATLLQNILSQNHDIYAPSMSALTEVLVASKNEFLMNLQYQHPSQENLLKQAYTSFYREGLKAYVKTITDKSYYIDKNFSWGYFYDFLAQIHNESPKIIFMVRDLRDIFSSMEKAFRSDILKINSHIDWNELKNTTMEKRIVEWSTKPPIALNLERLKEIINWGNSSKILFIKYEDFCQNPENEMKRIYKYLEIPYYIHDFKNVKKTTIENDILHFASHNINPKVSKNESKAIENIGQEACNWIYKNHEWFFKNFNYAKS